MSVPHQETAYAKINLALHVRKRRADGYHELETLFAFAEQGDVLWASPADDLSLTIEGPFAAGLDAHEDNLIVRAARALGDAMGIATGLSFRLEKNLPIAAGIGGGSADAAAALRAAAKLWGVASNDPALRAVAGRLGADVPACLLSQTCFGTGVGDQLEPFGAPDLAGRPLLLVNPRVTCPTGPVFQAWDGIDLGPLDPGRWQEGRNDLEPPARRLVPVIDSVLSALRAQPGLTLARMSGSGATCFALFETEAGRDAATAALAQGQPGWWLMPSRLRGA